jgi:hypothetical protein
MQTIVRNVNPLPAGPVACYLTADEAYAEGLQKTRDLRFAMGITRAASPCIHGNVLFYDRTKSHDLIDLFGYAAPVVWTLATNGRCECDGRRTTWSPLVVDAYTGDFDPDDGLFRHHEKGRCGYCTEDCGYGNDVAITLAEWDAWAARIRARRAEHGISDDDFELTKPENTTIEIAGWNGMLLRVTRNAVSSEASAA